jgi:hypothetical protein
MEELKLKNLTTHPYPCGGDNKLNSLKQRIRKYNMYLDEKRQYKSVLKIDKEDEYHELISEFNTGKFIINYECRDGIYGVYKD